MTEPATGAPSLHLLSVGAPFRYLWLKRVSGADLSVHCARCLLGDFDPRFGPGMATGDYPLDGETFYLCGVSEPYDWDRNLHVAFRHAPGRSFAFDEKGVSARLDGAERLPIPAPVPVPGTEHGADRDYYTCRNWQFARTL